MSKLLLYGFVGDNVIKLIIVAIALVPIFLVLNMILSSYLSSSNSIYASIGIMIFSAYILFVIFREPEYEVVEEIIYVDKE